MHLASNSERICADVSKIPVTCADPNAPFLKRLGGAIYKVYGLSNFVEWLLANGPYSVIHFHYGLSEWELDP